MRARVRGERKEHALDVVETGLLVNIERLAQLGDESELTVGVDSAQEGGDIDSMDYLFLGDFATWRQLLVRDDL